MSCCDMLCFAVRVLIPVLLALIRYKGLQVGEDGEFNWGFWGQECGPETDNTPERVHKYMEDAISVNTGKCCSSSWASQQMRAFRFYLLWVGFILRFGRDTL